MESVADWRLCMIKLRGNLKEVFNKFDTVTSMIFTTFNFEAQFFKDHIVQYLMDMDAIKTIAALNEANRWIKERNISIFYDRDAISDLDSSLTLNTYPVSIPNGVFHPKVIVLFGKKGPTYNAHIFVSSANLTASGYGRNIEGAANIEISTKEIAHSVRDFLEELFDGLDLNFAEMYPDLYMFLNSNSFPSDPNVEFFYSLGGGKHRLYDKLPSYPGKITIYSPYFSNDIVSMLKVFDGRNLTIVPALDGGKYNITRSAYEKLKDQAVNFIQINNERFSHAKIMIFAACTVVGSHNFTEAALYGHNAEASLIFNNLSVKNQPQIQTVKVRENCFLEDAHDLKNGDEISGERIGESVFVTVDWSKRSVEIKCDHIKLPCTVHIGRLQICELNKGQKKASIPFNVIEPNEKGIIFENLIQINKQYTVFREMKIILNGLINELCWEQCRPEFQFNSLDEALEEWFYASNFKSVGERAGEQGLPDIGSSFEEEEANEIEFTFRPETDVFDNYFNIFKAMSNVHKAISIEYKSSEEALYLIYKKSGGSICDLIRLLKEGNKESQDEIRTWIIFNELYLAMEDIKKQYNSLKKKGELLPIESFAGDIKRTISELKTEIQMVQKQLQQNVSNSVYFTWLIREFGYKEL